MTLSVCHRERASTARKRTGRVLKQAEQNVFHNRLTFNHVPTQNYELSTPPIWPREQGQQRLSPGDERGRKWTTYKSSPLGGSKLEQKTLFVRAVNFFHCRLRNFCFVFSWRPGVADWDGREKTTTMFLSLFCFPCVPWH